MKIIRMNNDNNSYYNLASEEYLLKYDKDLLNEDLFIIWQNNNAIIIGNNQNAHSEINQIYTSKNNIAVVRRISGGGAVYHDDGNINFTFIKRKARDKFKFTTCLSDILDFFVSIGLNATFSGRNDIEVNGFKIVGNAVYFYENDYLLHGCILFDTNLSILASALNVDKSKLISKGIESVKSRATNIKQFYNVSIEEFISKMTTYFENKYNTVCELIDFRNIEKVKELKETKFSLYDYNFGKTYDFNYSNKIKLPSGLIQVSLELEKTKIKNIEFYTDSLFAFNFKKLKDVFINQIYNIENIEKISKSVDLNFYYEGLDNKTLIELLFKND
ncbi:lipoate--protein ligase [Malacoplasma iowae]|uniref:lipoate--protein ligase n=1 Tax=Malacoplasma iowae DK-CPA TaxID=1394179 RepID=A0A084U4I4_MALIO|nr:lipoate--protein ligase [Malacoplasma iowae]KFB07870.1 lipoate-protein ligase A [Malacoplasma iowae DK-CPA]WPL41226.1 lipoate--protein ligase [Malacoplasma iowae]